jgi:DNA-directed RNA polymerase specialized sigma24 family protein
MRRDASPPSSPHLGDYDFHDLLRDVRAADGAACARLHDLFSPHLQSVIRHHLARPVEKLYDPVDLEQEVWVTFFADELQRQEFAHADNLTWFLDSMARNTARNVYRRHVAAGKRSLRREVPLGAYPEEAEEWIDPRVDPAGEVAAEDLWQGLLRRVKARDREILAALREGGDAGEVAARAGVSVRTVQRLLLVVRRWIEQ